ncbi:MAG: hypothetical protein ACYCS8_00570 [Acidithiobacillus sp.]
MDGLLYAVSLAYQFGVNKDIGVVAMSTPIGSKATLEVAGIHIHLTLRDMEEDACSILPYYLACEYVCHDEHPVALDIDFHPENITAPINIWVIGEIDSDWTVMVDQSISNDEFGDGEFEFTRFERWQENNHLSPMDKMLLMTLISGFCNRIAKEAVSDAH